MKPAALLLTASLVANIALVAFVTTRTPDSAHGISPAPSSTPSPAASVTKPSSTTTTLEAATAVSSDSRDLAVGRALSRYQQRLQAARATSAGDGRWWHSAKPNRTRDEEQLARRELAAALQAALGDDLGLTGTTSSQLSFLSPEKRAALLRITQDYDEMMAKFGDGGIQLASDKEKLRLLRSERDRDIAALLSPSELADYELHTSASAATLRARYGDAIQSEDDLRKLYALQKSFDEKFPIEAFTGRVTPDALRARSEAQQQLQSDMCSAIGDDKYTALRRAADPELRALDGLVARLNLPTTTADNIVTARATYATESQRINADTSLSPLDRRAQLQSLGNRAKSDLTTALGTEAADAYAPRANWIGLLQNGLAFSTTPTPNSPGSLSLAGGPTQSVFPVMPASTPGAPGTRQMVNVISNTSETTTSSGGGGTFFLGGGGAPVERGTSMQVISVSPPMHGDTTTTTTTTVTPAPKP